MTTDPTPAAPLTPQDLEEMKRMMITAYGDNLTDARDAAADFVGGYGNRCIAEIERLQKKVESLETMAMDLEDKQRTAVAESTRVQNEVAAILIAFQKGEITQTLDLMEKLCRVLGLDPISLKP